jgi:fibronectin type 3 domain-containing protein
MSELARPEIGDLSASILPKGVELSWSIPEAIKITEKGASHKFLIVKAPVKWTGRNCPECPVDSQSEVQQIDPAAPQPARKQGNRLFWEDPSVARNQAYRYQIIIQDKKERPEAQSNPVIAKVVPGPSRLRNLEAATQPQGIMLHWKKSTKDDQGKPLQGEIQYLIERRSGAGGWERISSVPVRANNFLDKAVASHQSYDYRVTPTIDFEGTLILGEPVISAKTKAPGAVPPPPPKTVWTIPAQGSIEVHWMESEGNAGGYHVYRKEGKEITRLTAAPVSKGPYVDRAVRKNSVYFYAVSAVNPQAEEKEGLLSKWVEIRSLQFE